ncbi:histone deacetylase [Magnetovibrio sp. PR-2]|uniref:histone deacetylase family protein n=1 Tax=Magnetovibrio sp. PR-2 TaxID=3120356 RepID=UPI002FCDF357
MLGNPFMRNTGIYLVLLIVFASGFAHAKNLDDKHMPAAVQKPVLPIVYHPNYNIRFLGLENFHPFDTRKYEKIYDYLEGAGLFDRFDPVQASMPSEADLLRVHPPAHLAYLTTASAAAKYTEMSTLAYLPNDLIDNVLTSRQRLATGGTVIAAQLALKHGWSINLGGGYHHAGQTTAEGFCAYADVPIAIEHVRANSLGPKKFLIIDFDAHQGNGHESIYGDDPNVRILDAFNAQVYPYAQHLYGAIDWSVKLGMGTPTEVYLRTIKNALHSATTQYRPDLIFYYAGSDILSGDPLGGLDVSPEGMAARDLAVFLAAKELEIPIVMTLSGGYQKSNADHIGKSIIGILTAFDLL